MRFIIPLIGRTKEAYLDAGIRDYTTRLSRFVPVELPVLREKNHRHDAEMVIRNQEAAALLEQAATANLCVALDPGGTMLSSEDWAEQLVRWEYRGLGTVCFLIGGHLGLDQTVLRKAELVWSFSRLTFTHEMSRLLLVEQLYRACTIKAGHKYHK